MKLTPSIILTGCAFALASCAPKDPRAELLKQVDEAWNQAERGEKSDDYMTSGEFADYRPLEPNRGSKPIHTRDIGRKLHLVGEFGTLYSPFDIEGIIAKPPRKRILSEDGKTIWIEFTKVKGEPYEAKFARKVYSTENLPIGNHVKLVIREKGELIAGDSIDHILSNPDIDRNRGPASCWTSLHLERVLSSTPPKGRDEGNE